MLFRSDGTDLEWISFIWAPILRTRSRRDFWSCSMVERTAEDFASSSERIRAFLEPTTKDEEVLGRHVLRADSHQVARSLTTWQVDSKLAGLIVWVTALRTWPQGIESTPLSALTRLEMLAASTSVLRGRKYIHETCMACGTYTLWCRFQQSARHNSATV